MQRHGLYYRGEGCFGNGIKNGAGYQKMLSGGTYELQHCGKCHSVSVQPGTILQIISDPEHDRQGSCKGDDL